MAGAPWPGRIFLDAGLFLYIGPGAGADAHAHNAVQLVRSLEGTFVVTHGSDRLERRAVLIPANTAHALDAAGRVIALLLVEPQGGRGAALDAAARHEGMRDLEAQLATLPFPGEDARAPDVATWCDRVLAAVGAPAVRRPISAATRRAIEYIEQHLDGVPRVRDVARLLGVSETRVTHQFSDEAGIPFRRFVLWTRIKRAVAEHQRGNDLTASALAAGFSDAAHFSRTFRAMFGLSPSLILAAASITGARPPR